MAKVKEPIPIGSASDAQGKRYQASIEEVLTVWKMWWKLRHEDDRKVKEGEERYDSVMEEFRARKDRITSLRSSYKEGLEKEEEDPWKYDFVPKKRTDNSIDKEVLEFVQANIPSWKHTIGLSSIQNIREKKTEEQAIAFAKAKPGRPSIFTSEAEERVLKQIADMQLRDECPFKEEIEEMVGSYPFCLFVDLVLLGLACLSVCVFFLTTLMRH
jgi:hypothetical protein